MNVELTYIAEDLRAVTLSIQADGTVSAAVPLIFAGDQYGGFDDPHEVQIAVTTEYEGVSRVVGGGRDPDGAPAHRYVRDELLRDPRAFYAGVVEMAAEDDE